MLAWVTHIQMRLGKLLFSFTLLPGGCQSSLTVFSTSRTDASTNLFRVSAMIPLGKMAHDYHCSVTMRQRLLMCWWYLQSTTNILPQTTNKMEETGWPEPEWKLPNHELNHNNNTQEWRGCREYLVQILLTTNVTWKADIV